MLLPKSRPQHLPTLTQVVTEAELLSLAKGPDVAQHPIVPLAQHSNFQDLVDLVMPKVVMRLREEMQANLEIQLHQFEAKIRMEVESMVREAVDKCEDFPDK